MNRSLLFLLALTLVGCSTIELIEEPEVEVKEQEEVVQEIELKVEEDFEEEILQVQPLDNREQMSLAPSTLSQFYDGQVKHNIPIDEVLSGGPRKDGIPSIDHPKFLLSPEVDYLEDEDLGILLTVNGNTRFYPYKIMSHHEIVNDSVGGEEIVVTYCPLCASGVAFSRLISVGVSEFGVSGLLYQSNLLMYDRSTQTLWDQLTGEAVVGQLTAGELFRIPSDIVSYGSVRKREFDVYVLSTDTGYIRDYNNAPYEGYDTNERTYFPTNADGDQRLHPKTLIYGIAIDGKAIAFTKDFIVSKGTFQGYLGHGLTKIPLYLLYNPDTEQLEVTRFFKDTPGKKEPLVPVPAFWFSWLAEYPETELVE